MRVISMQSPEVWEIIKRDGIYYADLNKCRERWNYKDDIAQLNGRVPIWCYWYPEISFYTMYNNELLEALRCEMSLQQDNCWDNFVMLELDVPSNDLHTGLQHNGSSFCKVFDHISIEMVQAVYELRDSMTDKEMGWYFKIIKPIYVSNSNVITTKEMSCEYWESVEDTYTDCFLEDTVRSCLICGKETKHTWLGKHYCCLAHMWKHKNQIIRTALIKGIDTEEALNTYNKMCTSDFTNSKGE